MLNPIAYTEKVVNDFLKYQLTTYPLADQYFYNQMRQLLNLEETRQTGLFKGPYISLNRSFRQGATIQELISQGLLHPNLSQIAPYPSLYGHQETAIKNIINGKTTLVSTGTGSGKTETFLYPIISRCLQLRDEQAPAGIVAVIVYPMNALAEDQLGRLRELLAGSGVTFGMYVGKTPEKESDAPGRKLAQEASKQEYLTKQKAQKNKENSTIYPAEETISREVMRKKPPQILLTNIKQLELLLTREKDVQMFDHAKLEFIVFDEAHTFTGAIGAETACLIRRLRTFCQKNINDITYIATSATIADPKKGEEAGRIFASRFFGVDQDKVVLVGEEYEADLWGKNRQYPPHFTENSSKLLKEVLDALETSQSDSQDIQEVFAKMTGYQLDSEDWQYSLYQYLTNNELIFQISEALQTPRLLSELVIELQNKINYPVTEAELLAWLALGATSRSQTNNQDKAENKNYRPLLRPIIHGFIRGVGGAIVTFPPEQKRPRLYLSTESLSSQDSNLFKLPITSCVTCGQHYFIHHVKDFNYCDKIPGGGDAKENNVIWQPLSEELGGNRLALFDQLISNDDEDEDQSHNKATPIYFCRYCGTIHKNSVSLCQGCHRPGDLVTLHAISQKPKHPGKINICLTCQTKGRDSVGAFREPAKVIKAVAVSDVHVLAQSMIHHADRRRLLVFADNRQDAAFQAGWMQDHARRYRLRGLMYEQIQKGPISIGDLTANLEDVLRNDNELSQTLIPEVWQVARQEATGTKHDNERHKFLRIQVLREVVTGVKQRIGLEPWGLMQIEYANLSPSLPFIEEWSHILGLSATDLTNGIASLLDHVRRNSILLDREEKIFSHLWKEGDFEVQRGYLPILQGIPKGLILQRNNEHDRKHIHQWLTSKNSTVAKQATGRWGIAKELIPDFITQIWEMLTNDLQLLVPTTLKYNDKKKVIPNCHDAHQIDADKLLLTPHDKIYRCQQCRRVHIRPTPKMACMAWRCNGTLQEEALNQDNYDLMVLNQKFATIRPREHSAQVPAYEREKLENMFKGNNKQVNTLVCTPTLELGVNIGSLDAVLMRNVPPLPANYWQRAGRAGRQHRMAVNLTYARQVSHDLAYFEDPLKLLQGIITPPSFNLRNDLMIKKHVHATVITTLQQIARHCETNEIVKDNIKKTLEHCIPKQVKHYLFENDKVREYPLDVSCFDDLINKHETEILNAVLQVFAYGWPPDIADVVNSEQLQKYIHGMTDKLTEIVKTLWKRLQWAIEQMNRLNIIRKSQGTLEADQDALYQRCDRLIKRLKGVQKRKKTETEGYDETNTYSVLAAEGFLPGYGLEIGSVLGTAQIPRTSNWLSDFELRRPVAMALREYMPGNLIYANGNRFVPRYYHFDPLQQPLEFQVNIENEVIYEIESKSLTTGTLGTSQLRAVPICDVDLPHQSQINDDEDYRFQMPVFIIGEEQKQHSGGKAYRWGSKNIHLRLGLHLRLINVGPTKLVQTGKLGYPVCIVCGQSRSPLTSEVDIDKFQEDHKIRCNNPLVGENTGFFANVIIDGLSIIDCADRQEAYSIGESIRIGASLVLEMEIEDLQLLTIAQSSSNNKFDLLLYDPMPGGSGLLQQIIERWEEIAKTALELVNNCKSKCDKACVDCLFTYRNSYYHRHLSRFVAKKKIEEYGHTITFSHDIPPLLPNSSISEEQPVNIKEDILRDMLIKAGFPEPIAQKQIDLSKPIGITTPDFFYEVNGDHFEGICIYLDGMSRTIHGNPERQERDNKITEYLENEGYEVIRITVSDISDQKYMTRIFYRLGLLILDKTQAKNIREDTSWFDK
jgi:hypothetical protein